MVAEFYRQRDGVDVSFTAKMFVSEVDADRNLPGIQNVWIQVVGCGEAIVNFNCSLDASQYDEGPKASHLSCAG